MELFAEIRREYQFGIGTIKGVSRKLGVHRRVVRQAFADAVPPERTYQPRATPTLDRVRDLIDRILDADRERRPFDRHRLADRVRPRVDHPRFIGATPASNWAFSASRSAACGSGTQ